MIWNVQDKSKVKERKPSKGGGPEIKEATETITDGISDGIYCFSVSDWKLIPEKRSKFVAIGLSKREENLLLYSLEKKQVVNTYLGHKVPVYSLALSPDGYSFVSGDQVGKMFLFDCQNASQFVCEMSIHEKVVFSIDYNVHESSGQLICSTGSDGVIQVMDMRARNSPKQAAVIDDAAASGVCFEARWRSEYEIVSVGDDYSAKRWDIRCLRDGPITNYFGHTTILKKITVSTDSGQNYIVTSGYDGSCRLWNLAERDILSQELENARGQHEMELQKVQRMEKLRDNGDDNYDPGMWKEANGKLKTLDDDYKRFLEISRERDGLNCVQAMLSLEGPKGTPNTGMSWLTKEDGTFSVIVSNSDLWMRLYEFSLPEINTFKLWREMFNF